MKAAGWIAAGSLAAALGAVAVAGRGAAPEILLGMLAPLVATSVSWVLTERTYTRAPAALTALTTSGFAAKMVFFGAYVAAVIKGVEVKAVPFVVSFTSFFVGLYAVEALLMRNLFSREISRRSL